MTTVQTTAGAPVAAAPLPARLAAVAGIAGGVALVVKVASIIATSDTVPASVTGALYVAGLLLAAVAAGATGVHLARRRGIALKILAAVALVLFTGLYVTMLSDAVELLVAPFTDTHYILDETPIALLGVAWLIVGLRMRGARQ